MLYLTNCFKCILPVLICLSSTSSNTYHNTGLYSFKWIFVDIFQRKERWGNQLGLVLVLMFHSVLPSLPLEFLQEEPEEKGHVSNLTLLTSHNLSHWISAQNSSLEDLSEGVLWATGVLYINLHEIRGNFPLWSPFQLQSQTEQDSNPSPATCPQCNFTQVAEVP